MAVGLLQQPARPVIDEVRVHVRAVQLADAAAKHVHGGGDVGQQQLVHALHVIKRDVERRGRRCTAAAGETRHEAAAAAHGPLAGEWGQEVVLAVGVVAVVCTVVVLVCAAPACLRSFAHVPGCLKHEYSGNGARLCSWGLRVAAPSLEHHGEHVGAFEVPDACFAVAALPKRATIYGTGPEIPVSTVHLMHKSSVNVRGWARTRR